MDHPNAPSETSVRAVVRQILPNGMVSVEVPGAGAGRLLRGHLAHGARAVLTRLVPGDRVLVEVSPFDSGECRILGRPTGARGR
ncbi:MAG: hypothetical protein HMLKMBBP_00931 [Planctomycetes bacterium]|nr:hypothetical protein [Planctomycetota bacterium]